MSEVMISRRQINTSGNGVLITDIVTGNKTYEVVSYARNNQFSVRLFGGGGSGTRDAYRLGFSGFMNNDILTLTPGAKISITVGSGAYYVNSKNYSTTGGTTSFGTYLSAEGGSYTRGGSGAAPNNTSYSCWYFSGVGATQFGGGSGIDGGVWGGGGGGYALSFPNTNSTWADRCVKAGNGGMYGGGGGSSSAHFDDYGWGTPTSIAAAGNGGTYGGGGGGGLAKWIQGYWSNYNTPNSRFNYMIMTAASKNGGSGGTYGGNGGNAFPFGSVFSYSGSGSYWGNNTIWNNIYNSSAPTGFPIFKNINLPALDTFNNNTARNGTDTTTTENIYIDEVNNVRLDGTGKAGIITNNNTKSQYTLFAGPGGGGYGGCGGNTYGINLIENFGTALISGGGGGGYGGNGGSGTIYHSNHIAGGGSDGYCGGGGGGGYGGNGGTGYTSSSSGALGGGGGGYGKISRGSQDGGGGGYYCPAISGGGAGIGIWSSTGTLIGRYGSGYGGINGNAEQGVCIIQYYV